MPYPSFEAFVEARLPALVRYGMVLAGQRADAEDLVQEALVRTGVAWWRVRRRDDPEAYVRRTMLRLAINGGRRRGREVVVDAVPERVADDAGFGRVDDGLDLARAYDALPPGMRAVLVLRYLDGLDDDAVAAALGCSRATVRSQASRALAKLRAASAATTPGGGDGRD